MGENTVTDRRTGIKISSNGSAAGNHFLEVFYRCQQEQQEKEETWIAKLRADGVKAAHPDDGWVDRKCKTVHFAYPQFNDGAGVGDRVALGTENEYRIVTLTGEAGLALRRWAYKNG